MRVLVDVIRALPPLLRITLPLAFNTRFNPVEDASGRLISKIIWLPDMASARSLISIVKSPVPNLKSFLSVWTICPVLGILIDFVELERADKIVISSTVQLLLTKVELVTYSPRLNVPVALPP